MKRKSYPSILQEYTFENSYMIFLLDPLKVSFDLPYEICPGITFDRANEEEKETIKGILDTRNLFHGPYSLSRVLLNDQSYVTGNPDKPYKENEQIDLVGIGSVVIFTSEESENYAVKILDCEWDYWVIRIAENTVTNREYFLLLDALLFSAANLSVGLAFEEIGGLNFYIDIERFYQRHPIKLVYKSGRADVKDYRKSLSLDQLRSATNVFNLIREVDFEEYSFIGQAIREYVNLLALPVDSSLNIVGLFSILELLVTNDSRSTGSPGITWQLKKKIPLLNHRFNMPLDFPKLLNAPSDTKEETIIERLYFKRSLIAHGNKEIESFDKKLQLISQGDAVEFLRLLIRKIIVYSLKDPQLLQDLREC